MSDDVEVTRTGDSEGAGSSDEPKAGRKLVDHRPVAPLQYRDPERYQVLGEHGRGGLGYVQRAHDKELGRDVAIKEMITRGDLGEVRFLREAMITARLEHPGIVPIHEAGRWPDGTPFYVMKLVAGRSLKQLLKERTTIPARLGLLHHVIAIADAVAYAHDRHIIHRDLKPANVMVGDFGETIVIDWGLAKDLRAEETLGPSDGPYRGCAAPDLTAAGSILGTPIYMAPEQARGEPVDRRADVFAIGSMLWELCSLQRVPPEEADERVRQLRRARIDRDLITIIMKALEPDPAHRYQSAGELAADLKAFKAGARIAARDYSVLAILTHWIRRHRWTAASLVLAGLVAIVGSAFYVRNISIERDRADAAAALAAQERDQAKLAQARALLRQDPARARDVLVGLGARTPLHALLLSRAERGASARVVQVRGGIARLLKHPQTSEIVFVSDKRELVRFEPTSGSQQVIARDVPGAVTPLRRGWAFAQRPFSASLTSVVGTDAPHERSIVGDALKDSSGILLAAAGGLYALDRGTLYSLVDGSANRMRDHVRSVAGSDRVLLVCSMAGELEVMLDGNPKLRTSCASNPSWLPMAASGTSYAALLEPTTLLLVRGTQTLRLRTQIAGEYEIALASSGLFALADFDGKPWFVRPGSQHLELGPPHGARLVSVAADGDIAAWGYEDGVIIALDTRTTQSWTLVGHGTAAGQLAIDHASAKLVSFALDDLRVWNLPPSPVATVTPLPCVAFNVAMAPDGKRAALDCSDGRVREWTLATGVVRELHHHENVAFGVGWRGNAACSAGFDGRVMCTESGKTVDLRRGSSRVTRMIEAHGGVRLLVATDDGAVGEAGGSSFYKHASAPYSLALSVDGRRLASGAEDGTLIVYDLGEGRIRSSTVAHAGLVFSIVWRQGELWTTGSDGAIKQWRDDPQRLTLLRSFAESPSGRFLELFSDGWSAVSGGRTLIVQRASGSFRLELEGNIERVDVSSDQRYIATSTGVEVVVLDLKERRVATLPVGSIAGYSGFVRDGFLVLGLADSLVSARLDDLDYVKYGDE